MLEQCVAHKIAKLINHLKGVKVIHDRLDYYKIKHLRMMDMRDRLNPTPSEGLANNTGAVLASEVAHPTSGTYICLDMYTYEVQDKVELSV